MKHGPAGHRFGPARAYCPTTDTVRTCRYRYLLHISDKNYKKLVRDKHCSFLAQVRPGLACPGPVGLRAVWPGKLNGQTGLSDRSTGQSDANSIVGMLLVSYDTIV